MKRHLIGPFAVALLAACGGSAPPAEAPPPSAPIAPVAADSIAPEPLAPAAPAAPAPREPSEAEKKAAVEKAKLEADWAKMLADHSAEAARLTPEVRTSAQPIAEKAYPSAKAAIQAALAGKHRNPKHVERDATRHPVEMLTFFGFQPTQTVLEYGPGEGWYTEILAPALAKKGKLLVTTADPNGPKAERPTLYGERTKLFIQRAPELYGRIDPVVIDPKAPDLKLEGTVDMALVFRGMHGMVNTGTLDVWLSEIHSALKPNGVLAVEQHRAAEGADPIASSKAGYLPEKWLIEQITAKGFKLAAKSELNANPKDTKDHPEGVWTLPPTFRLGDKDRQKYAAIGESDRMTLKFVKVPPKADHGSRK